MYTRPLCSSSTQPYDAETPLTTPTGKETVDRQSYEWITEHYFIKERETSSSGIQDDPDTLCDLGVRYTFGDSVVIDEKKAFNLFTQGANQGHSRSKFMLARCYEFGLGTNRDKMTAEDFYSQSANLGYEPAQKKIKIITLRIQGPGRPSTSRWFGKRRQVARTPKIIAGRN